MHIGFHETNVPQLQCLNIHIDTEDVVLPNSHRDYYYLASVAYNIRLSFDNKILNIKLMHVLGTRSILGKPRRKVKRERMNYKQYM